MQWGTQCGEPVSDDVGNRGGGCGPGSQERVQHMCLCETTFLVASSKALGLFKTGVNSATSYCSKQSSLWSLPAQRPPKLQKSHLWLPSDSWASWGNRLRQPPFLKLGTEAGGGGAESRRLQALGFFSHVFVRPTCVCRPLTRGR